MRRHTVESLAALCANRPSDDDAPLIAGGHAGGGHARPASHTRTNTHTSAAGAPSSPPIAAAARPAHAVAAPTTPIGAPNAAHPADDGPLVAPPTPTDAPIAGQLAEDGPRGHVRWLAICRGCVEDGILKRPAAQAKFTQLHTRVMSYKFVPSSVCNQHPFSECAGTHGPLHLRATICCFISRTPPCILYLVWT